MGISSIRNVKKGGRKKKRIIENSRKVSSWRNVKKEIGIRRIKERGIKIIWRVNEKIIRRFW